MILYPAIDIQGGRCVRLFQGRMEEATVYGDDPAAMARRWVDEGAGALHVVDLDGARNGRPQNVDEVLAIRSAVAVPIQVGGGLRSHEAAAAYLEAGIERVVLGTRAAVDADFLAELCAAHPGRVAVGIDARDGLVALKGWTEIIPLEADELARRVENIGASAIIYTDIARDGTLTGPNVEAVAAVARGVALPVIASGGVATVEDLRSLKALAADGVEGVIVGKALYEGTVSVAEALSALSEP
ncbi:MAG: 1-(5-phosphoribosyl)-5-[(5-phosphoribosylamino)methylideneamino]imidazole-4-carboxamide isomerase [bacterium]|nr:1-(5-phosphoribosyl)-5-[(5-phosphoribosylamino)methylideneamino]imidazole-4-carboxamide isomerase [bacterium]MDV2479454.1 1-(5-phosphoribosyl)-5-[(5-phosphoribosylamino)methylideneamino]imidazole-4-carboxamide isomerase [bacterium]